MRTITAISCAIIGVSFLSFPALAQQNSQVPRRSALNLAMSKLSSRIPVP
jgi:hypothetical protein